MDADAGADLLNRLLVKTFALLGASGPMVRSFLLRDRYYVGQKFRCGGLQAVLPAGKEEIEFGDQAGTLLKTVTLLRRSRRRRSGGNGLRLYFKRVDLFQEAWSSAAAVGSTILEGRDIMLLSFGATRDGRLRPFSASAGSRPGIYAG